MSKPGSSPPAGGEMEYWDEAMSCTYELAEAEVRPTNQQQKQQPAAEPAKAGASTAPLEGSDDPRDKGRGRPPSDQPFPLPSRQVCTP